MLLAERDQVCHPRLRTGEARSLAPWPVEILELPDPEEPEPILSGSRERHGSVAVSSIRPSRLFLSTESLPRRWQMCC